MNSALRSRRKSRPFAENHKAARAVPLLPALVGVSTVRTTFFSSQKLTCMMPPPRRKLGTCIHPVLHPASIPAPIRARLRHSIFSIVVSMVGELLKNNDEAINGARHANNRAQDQQPRRCAEITIGVAASEDSRQNSTGELEPKRAISTIRDQRVSRRHNASGTQARQYLSGSS